MAVKAKLQKLPMFIAGEDLSDDQYTLVKLDETSDDREVVKCTSYDDNPIGVLQNAPEEGKQAEVAYAGLSKVQVEADISPSDVIVLGDDDAGHVQPKEAADLDEEYTVVGQGAIPASAGAVGSVLINTVKKTMVDATTF